MEIKMKTYYIQDTLENELDYTNFVQQVGKEHIQLFKKGEEPVLHDPYSIWIYDERDWMPELGLMAVFPKQSVQFKTFASIPRYDLAMKILSVLLIIATLVCTILWITYGSTKLFGMMLLCFGSLIYLIFKPMSIYLILLFVVLFFNVLYFF